MFVPNVYVWYPQRSEEHIDALKLELQTTVSCHMNARNQTWVLERSN